MHRGWRKYLVQVDSTIIFIFHVSFQEHNGENIEKGYMLQVYYILTESEINSFDISL